MIDKNYTGYLLASNPGNPDDHWANSVMLIGSHGPDLSITFQINKRHPILNLGPIGEKLGIEGVPEAPVYFGGDKSPHKIYIIHSLEWQSENTMIINNELGVSTDISALAAIASGLGGPHHWRAVAGHLLWPSEELMRTIMGDVKIDSRRQFHRWEPALATVENTLTSEGRQQWSSALESAAAEAVRFWFNQA